MKRWPAFSRVLLCTLVAMFTLSSFAGTAAGALGASLPLAGQETDESGDPAALPAEEDLSDASDVPDEELPSDVSSTPEEETPDAQPDESMPARERPPVSSDASQDTAEEGIAAPQSLYDIEILSGSDWTAKATNGVISLSEGKTLYIGSNAGSPAEATSIKVTGALESTATIISEAPDVIENLRVRVASPNMTLAITNLRLRAAATNSHYAGIDFYHVENEAEGPQSYRSTPIYGILLFTGNCEVYGNGEYSNGLRGILTLTATDADSRLTAYGAGPTEDYRFGSAGIYGYTSAEGGNEASMPGALIISENTTVTAIGGGSDEISGYGGDGVRILGQMQVRGTLNAVGADGVGNSAGMGVNIHVATDTFGYNYAEAEFISRIYPTGVVNATGGNGGNSYSVGAGRGLYYAIGSGAAVPFFVEGTLNGTAGVQMAGDTTTPEGVDIPNVRTADTTVITGVGNIGVRLGIGRNGTLWGTVKGTGKPAGSISSYGHGSGIHLSSYDSSTTELAYTIMADLMGTALPVPSQSSVGNGIYLSMDSAQKFVLFGSITPDPDLPGPENNKNLYVHGSTGSELEIAKDASVTLLGSSTKADLERASGLYTFGGTLTVNGTLHTTGAAKDPVRNTSGLSTGTKNGAGIYAQGDVAIGATAKITASGGRTNSRDTKTQGFPIIAEKYNAPVSCTVAGGAVIQNGKGENLYKLTMAQSNTSENYVALGNETRLYAFAFDASYATPVVFVPAGAYNAAPEDLLAFGCSDNYRPAATTTVAANHANTYTFDAGYGWSTPRAAPPTGVTVNGANNPSITLPKVGDSVQLSPVVAPAGAARLLKWENPYTAGIISIEDGKVTALANGETGFYIRTFDENNYSTKSCYVTVRVGTVSVTGVSLNAATKAAKVGTPFTLTATVRPTNATNPKVTWTSSAPTVATVSSTGKVTPVKAGTATITVKTADGAKTAKCTVTVTRQTQTITAKSYSKVYGNAAFSLGATRTTGGGTLSYKSSSTGVCTVDGTGKVTIKGCGKSTITITAAENTKYAKATKTVTVTVVPKKPAAPTVTSPVTKKVKVTWKKDAKATGYEVQLATNKTFTKGKKSAPIAKNTTVTKTFTSLKKGTTYYVRVRAYKTIDGVKKYGAWSTVKYVKCK